MRKGWKEVRLGDVISTNKSNLNKNYKFEKILYVDISSVGSGDISFNDEILLNEAPSRAKRLVKNGDTIISSVRPANRNFAYFKEVPHNLVVSTGFTTLHPNVSEINSRYLYYLISNEIFTEYLVSVEKGANYPAVTAKDIEDYVFNLPPLETQKKIASILSGYDDLIENNLKRIKILEEMAQQTYEEWFVRMRFPGHQSATINSATGLPEGWKQCRMGEILNFTNGFAFKSKDYVENGIYSIVTIKNVQEGYFENSKFDKILEIPSKVKESQRLKTGDLVMSLTGNVGRLCFVYGESLLLNQRVCKIDSKAIGFVYCTLRSSYFKNKIENLANGAAQQNLSTIDMENLIIDFPKNELIDEFESFVNPIFNSILNLNIQNQRLREARDILLPRLMMGMIEV